MQVGYINVSDYATENNVSVHSFEPYTTIKCNIKILLCTDKSAVYRPINLCFEQTTDISHLKKKMLAA
jgi:hypothetical protein